MGDKLSLSLRCLAWLNSRSDLAQKAKYAWPSGPGMLERHQPDKWQNNFNPVGVAVI
jgi:hypothetical protein